jgi:predicted ATPase
MSDFSSALSYFMSGISFLPNNHWKENYELSLELLELAARCSLATGDMDGLSILSDKVINHAKCFEDKLNTSFTVMSAFAYSSKVARSVEMGLMIVLKLGVDIPKLSHEDTVHKIRSTQKMLLISDADLLNYRLMSDNRQLMAMKFLAKLQNATHQIQPGLQPIIAIKMVELTLASGLSPMSPIGFACFGGLVAKLNDIRGGYRFAKLAKALVNKLESNEVAGEVTWLSTEIISFVEPLQTSNELRIQGATMAMAAGDIHWACFNKMSSTINLLWTGSNLSHAKETCSATIRFIEEQGKHVSTNRPIKISFIIINMSLFIKTAFIKVT